MKIVLLTILALIAFAANSVLTRAALALGEIGPGMFMSVRLASGAITLAALVAFSGGLKDLKAYAKLGPAAMLLLYMAGFSYAYVTIDTGTGALILFGGVQVTMFFGAILSGERPSAFLDRLWAWNGGPCRLVPVSYTHLTLPTIYSV